MSHNNHSNNGNNGLGNYSTRNETSSSTSSSSRSTSLSQSQPSSFISPTSPNIRSISLIDYIQFKFDGNISKHGIALADCDNDGKNELLVGTLNGELFIFKGSSTLPLATAKDLGIISCVLVGDILNKNKNYIVTISIEGYLNIYAFNTEYHDIHSTSLNPTTARRSSNFGSVPLSNVKLPPTITDNEEFSSTSNLILHHYQQIQANAMCALIADIDNDGLNEFIVALSDRVVRSYRAAYQGEDMKLVGIHKWEFSDQIGSITLFTSWDKPGSQSGSENLESLLPKKSVLVAQNGGVFAKLTCYDAINDNATLKDGDNENEHEIDHAIGLRPEYKNITTLPPLRNPQISSEIISNIVSSSTCSEVEDSKLISAVTADGLLMLLDEENVRWQCQLEQKAFSLQKHDIDQDGRDELVVCTWNGQTYLINLDGRIVTCLFDQPVSAFKVGHYDLNGYRMSCLVYGTFTNSVYLYYNIDCPFTIDTSDNVFLDYVRSNNPKLMQQLETLVKRLNNKDPNTDSGASEHPEFKVDSKLIHDILYGVPLKLP